MTTYLRVSIPAALSAQVDRLTVAHGFARSDFVRQAILLYLRVLEADARGEKLALIDRDSKVLYQILFA